LMQVDLDSRIPPELYQAVAELLAWLYRLESGVADEEVPAGAPGPGPAPDAAGTAAGTGTQGPMPAFSGVPLLPR
jgi:flagellar biosynthesis protein